MPVLALVRVPALVLVLVLVLVTWDERPPLSLYRYLNGRDDSGL